MAVSEKKIVIIGAGFGGVYTYRALLKKLSRSIEASVTLINPKNYFLFTPLLHEVATGGISPENIIEPLRKVLPHCGSRGFCHGNFMLGIVERLRLTERIIETSSGQLNYDFLVLAPGSQTNFYNTSGASEYCLTLKSLDDALRLKNQIITNVEQALRESDHFRRASLLHFVVIGGGPTGVELAAELSEFIHDGFGPFYPKVFLSEVKISLVQSGPELLPQFSKTIRQKAQQVLTDKGVEVKLNKKVVAVTAETITLSDGSVLSTATAIWVAGVKPNLPLFDKNLATDQAGRVTVGPNLALTEHPEVFILGDAAAVKDAKTNQTIPTLAQAAVQQAECVASNIVLALHNRPLQAFQYRHRGDLVSIGQWMAAGEISRFPLAGHFAWWLWRTVYLTKLLSWPKKLQVMLDWTIDLFSPRDISQF